MIYLFAILLTLFNFTMWWFLFMLTKDLDEQLSICNKDIKTLTDIVQIIVDNREEGDRDGEDSKVQEG